METSINLK